MRTTILFGGTNKERLVSAASAQALCEALPEAELWFWAADAPMTGAVRVSDMVLLDSTFEAISSRM